MQSRDLKVFLKANQISAEIWEKSICNWEELLEIADDHDNRQQELEQSAALHASMIQSIEHVHSVRWRIKNTGHLVKKIIRKRAEGKDKYHDIGIENYSNIVTDLIGIRALHLFKSDALSIHEHIKDTWKIEDVVTAYLRAGDPIYLREKFEKSGMIVLEHPFGYRSVHYVVSSQPIKRTTKVEIQVRTIFEEGWSEVDHRIRYPNPSDSEIISQFLSIFNRLAGSADEMADFVQGLTGAIEMSRDAVEVANKERDIAAKEVEKLITKLENSDKASSVDKQALSELRSQVAAMSSSRSRSLLDTVNIEKIAALEAYGNMEPSLQQKLAALASVSLNAQKVIDGMDIQKYEKMLHRIKK